MTTEQDLRFIEALGPRSNLVSSEAEIIFQGSVARLEYVLDKNIYNNTMVYTALDLNVEDRLRGVPGDIFQFRTIGGSYNGRTLHVNGMPLFSTSDQFLLFLKKTGERYSVVRGDWGKIDL